MKKAEAVETQCLKLLARLEVVYYGAKIIEMNGTVRSQSSMVFMQHISILVLLIVVYVIWHESCSSRQLLS